jgi:hypothetical protein
MADWPPKRAAAFTVTFPIYDADGDLVSAAATLDSEVSKDAGTFTDVTAEATEIATTSGMYTLALTATEMTADIVATITKTTTAGAKTAVNVMYTAARQLIDLAFPAVSGRSLAVDASGRVDLGLWVGVAPSALITGRVDANAQVVGDKTGYALTAAEQDGIVDKVWDELLSAHVAAGSFGRAAQPIRDGTAAGGAVGSITLDAAASAVDDFYNDAVVQITGATGVGQARLILDYVGATKVASVSPNWITAPDATSVFVIRPAARVDVATWLGAVVNALLTGRVDVSAGAMQTGVIIAAAFAAGAIDAAAIATDAIGSLEFAQAAADKVWASVTRNLTALGFVLAAADIGVDAIGASELAVDAANEIADAIMTRASSNWEATAPVKSLGAAVMKAVHRIRDNVGTLEIYRSDGLTIHASQVVTADATLNPVDELTGAV